MTFSTGLLDQSLKAARVFEGDDLASAPGDRLLDLQHVLAEVRRHADALLATVAGEVARRSDPADGLGGLSRKKGFSSPGQLIAGATGGSTSDANKLADVGALLSPARQEPAPFPVLSEAVRTGRLSVDAAALLKKALEQLSGSGVDDLGTIESRMVARAEKLPLPQIRKMIAQFQARTAPEEWEAKDRRLRADRGVWVRDEADGMVSINARLDPATAAPIVAVLDAHVKAAFQRRRDRANGNPMASQRPDEVDDRTAPQIRADVLAALCAHSLDCDSATDGVKTTVIVRVSEESLRTGNGVGEIDGLGRPVSAGTLRRMAVDAEVLPVVLGGESEPLDVGRSRRLFTRAQKIALVERDGGCAWCHAPPSWCEAHHIEWWERDRGPTDLSNGVMLCTSCHHRLHDGGWKVEVRGAEVWFTPPVSVDRTRTPRIGGRARYKLSA